jgi:hypothetical protein
MAFNPAKGSISIDLVRNAILQETRLVNHPMNGAAFFHFVQADGFFKVKKTVPAGLFHVLFL